MKERNKTMKNIVYRIVLLVMVAVFALPAMAQFDDSQYSAQAPGTSFQSTSTLSGSGSAYSSNPTLGGDGTATYSAASYSSVKSSGIRRTDSGGITPPDDEDDDDNPNPIGDALSPLMLLAMVYAVWCIVYRRKRRLG